MASHDPSERGPVAASMSDRPAVAGADTLSQIGHTGTVPPPPGRRFDAFWREWLKPLLIIGFTMMTFRSAVADWNDVPTGSMKPTIIEGDRIFINKVAYDLKVPFTTLRLFDWGDPAWGDIVVLRSPEDGKRLVKRVVGLPGDQIEIRRGRLLVNGTPAEYLDLASEIVNQIDLEEQPSYIFATEALRGCEHAAMWGIAGSHRNYGPVLVQRDHYFVMGDNRDNSYDSRRFGQVHHDAILGRATAIALSVDRDDYFMPRWERFFSRLR